MGRREVVSSSFNDCIIAYDHDGYGKMDHFHIYWPGECILWILRNRRTGFIDVSGYEWLNMSQLALP